MQLHDTYLEVLLLNHVGVIHVGGLDDLIGLQGVSIKTVTARSGRGVFPFAANARV